MHVQDERHRALRYALDALNKQLERLLRREVAVWFPMGVRRGERVLRLVSREATLLTSRERVRAGRVGSGQGWVGRRAKIDWAPELCWLGSHGLEDVVDSVESDICHTRFTCPRAIHVAGVFPCALVEQGCAHVRVGVTPSTLHSGPGVHSAAPSAACRPACVRVACSIWGWRAGAAGCWAGACL